MDVSGKCMEEKHSKFHSDRGSSLPIMKKEVTRVNKARPKKIKRWLPIGKCMNIQQKVLRVQTELTVTSPV